MSELYEHTHILYEVGKMRSFKLLWLPVLARNEVIRSMDIHEIIKLSLSSRKTEGMIRYAKVKVSSIQLYVNINSSILQIVSLNKKWYACGPDHQKEGSNNLGPQILTRWIDKSSTSFQNCVSIFKHLQNIISFKSLCLCVNFEGMTVEFLKEILTEPALKDFSFLRLENGEIDAECLDLVMETAHSNINLHIKGTKIPDDYYHEKAFKFSDIIFWEAEWVRIEHLFTSKNGNSVCLDKHNLTYFDVKTYIKYWIDNDYDMVHLLILVMSETFQTESLFDGMVVLLGRRREYTFYLIASNPTKQRKHKIMGVGWFNSILHLGSWGEDEPIELQGNFDADPWEPEYRVLRTLNKKKELEGELEKIQKLLETNQDECMVEKKDDISRELQIVSDELDSYNLVFRNGVYSYY